MDITRVVADVIKDKRVAGVVVDLIEEMIASADIGTEEITDILDTEKMSMDFLLKWFSFYGVDFRSSENGEIDRAAARRYRALLRKRGELEAIGSVIQSGGGLFVKEPIEARLWMWDTVPKWVEAEPEDGFLYVRTSNPNIITDSPLIDKVTPAGYTYLTTLVKLTQEVLAIIADPHIWLNKYWERGTTHEVTVAGKWWERGTHLPVFTRPALMDNQWQASGAQWEGATIAHLTQRLQGYLDQYINIMRRTTVGHYLKRIDHEVVIEKYLSTSRERGVPAPIDANLSRRGVTNIWISDCHSTSNNRHNPFMSTREATTVSLMVREMTGYLGQVITIQPFRYLSKQGNPLLVSEEITKSQLRVIPGRPVPNTTQVTMGRTRGITKPLFLEREKETKGTVAVLTREGWSVARSTRKESHLTRETTILREQGEVNGQATLVRTQATWVCKSPIEVEQRPSHETLSIKERRVRSQQVVSNQNKDMRRTTSVRGRLRILETMTYWCRTGTTVARSLIQPSDTQIQTLVV